MSHLARLGALLALVVVAFLLLKLVPMPAEMEGYGFYWSEDNAAEWANLPPLHSDSYECNSCHQDNYSMWLQSEHSSVSCESCHGPAATHVQTNSSLIILTSRESCGVCHERLLSRPSDFPQVDLAEHGGQVACIDCHNPHDPKIAAPPLVPHTLEGRSDCLVCHQTGGVKPFPQDHASRSNDSCLSCHSTD